MNNMGEMLLEHYQKYLGEFIGAEPYSDNEHQIQLLGFDNIFEDFSKQHNKTAVYFTESYVLPEDFSTVGGKCKVYMGFFISPDEADYVKKYGCEQFEELLEEKETDVIALDRNPAI